MGGAGGAGGMGGAGGVMMACRENGDCAQGEVCDQGECRNPNLVEALTADGRFGTLLAAVDAANLTDALRGENQLTVFAPTDAAFQALEDAQPGTIQSLLDDPATLLNILLYHVVAGRQVSGRVVAAESLRTLEGRSLTISVQGEDVRINDISLVAVEIEANNGLTDLQLVRKLMLLLPT